MKNPWLPVLFWMGLIFWFSHQDGTVSGLQSGWILNGLTSVGIPEDWVRSPGFVWMIRKSAHFTEYGILGLLLRRTGLHVFSIIAFLVGYASLDELHQSFIPGRSAALTDVGIDTAGGLTGFFSSFFLSSKSGQKR